MQKKKVTKVLYTQFRAESKSNSEIYIVNFFSLSRYDTIVDEISLNFPELFIIGKYVKIRFKNRVSPCYFLSSRGEKIKKYYKN